ncbi:VOC family protein [Bacillus pseudomycoides]|uniref:VOC family protein n=1 Tax=Bacillus pseudomycoides TaxID=64104 RepID=UPI000BEE62CE|nr:VOC family protein [Bacillus pseudomycoides]PED07886.1 glyoxalase [Bacillus pseudomycoides]PEI90016.1 glyoxalase [Bacillus pseudomycoides]PEK24306.1 glyoxalase [Bacillus pseudomycoides]PEM77167.1 glyoxalase [Bacillus pseudomycoides]PEO07872.1 glyoxalase [Bacillus pseudomycoides]
MLINRVTLYSNALEEMRDFYLHKLGFHLLENSGETSFSIQVGESELEFCKNNSNTNPFYHFAFNIPSNKFSEAKEWAKNRVVLNIEDGADEVYFPRSNAHSFYFIDPAGNIVEFISRHMTSPESNEPFSVHSILNVSEMSMTTDQVLKVGNQLIDIGIPVRDEEELSDGFYFMGENGVYLLLGPSGRRWFFSDLNAEVHPLRIEVDNERQIEINRQGECNISIKK